jgi:hypothetical protein
MMGTRCSLRNQFTDIIATVNLFPTHAGGRRGSTPGEKFNCLMVIDEKNFDVRLHLEGLGAISPGQTVRVPISFLDREHAKKYCSVGKTFILREVSTIGDGVIDDLVSFDDVGRIR